MILVLVLLAAAVALWPTRRGGGFRSLSMRDRATTEAGGERRAEPRDDLVVEDCADALVLLAVALRAGRGTAEAIEETAAVAGGVAGQQLRVVAAAMRWDRTPEEAWAYAHPVWRPAALALTVAHRTGAPPAAAVLGAAARIREDARRRQEAAAAKAGVMLVVPLGLLFLPAFVCTAVVPVVAALAGRALSGS